MDAVHPWLRAQDIELEARPPSKRAVLETLSRLLAARLGTTPRAVFDALWQREALGSTALGRGVALPHARLAELPSAVGAFLRLQHPVAFDAPDDKPVEFVLALLLPRRDPQRQLDLLAGIAAKFSEATFRAQVAEAPDASAVQGLLTAGLLP
jgi:PTS system nitrogen regulatory IIA component